MKISEQKYIGNWWGLFKLLTTHVVSYINLINFATTFTVLYIVSGGTFAVLYGAGIVVLVLVAYFMEYKYSWGSYFSVWNKQIWNHNNPQREQLERMEKKLDYLLKGAGVDPEDFK